MRYAQSNYERQKLLKQRKGIFAIVLLLILIISTYCITWFPTKNNEEYIGEISQYAGQFIITLNGDTPFFEKDDISSECFLSFSELDSLNRCHAAFSCLGRELFPAEERGSIGMVKPSGWHTIRYDDIIEDHYLYNRCHLIAFMLSGENANEKNLITGTRYLNVSGMLPLENQVHDYIERTGNHVMYRVTPVYNGNDLVAYGVLMEALSVEDAGKGISFCRFIYNIQPGIKIDYSTGISKRS